MAKKLISGWSLIGALVTVIILLVIYAVIVRVIFPAPKTPSVIPTPIMVIVNAATPTGLFQPNSTPLPIPTATLDPEKYGGIGIGGYVQITGTGGDGLRLRSGPGTDNPPLFLGLEAEVFQVKDGPKEANEKTWWFLVSPSDDNRQGWAAANYLTLLPSNR